MCDGGWGLVCPEAHEAAAAWKRKTERQRGEAEVRNANGNTGDYVETLTAVKVTQIFLNPHPIQCQDHTHIHCTRALSRA